MNQIVNVSTPGSNNDPNLRNRSSRHHVKKGNKDFNRIRKRTSPIDSPSDLIFDEGKDKLLTVSSDDQREFEFIINEQFYAYRYENSNKALRYFYDEKKTFLHALELFNRINCVCLNGIWKSQNYFFECKGAIRVVQRMCTRCRDSDKPKTRTDLYYVNLAEKNHERTVYCHGCMGKVLQQEIGSNALKIEKQLSRVRRQQKSSEIFIISSGR